LLRQFWEDGFSYVDTEAHFTSAISCGKEILGKGLNFKGIRIETGNSYLIRGNTDLSHSLWNSDRDHLLGHAVEALTEKT